LVNGELVIVGASSELAKSFIELLQNTNFKILLISRKTSKELLSSNTEEIIVKDYLNDFSKIKKELIKLKNPIIIYFNGVLFENRPIQVPTQAEIELTKKINYEIPFNLSRKINPSKRGELEITDLNNLFLKKNDLELRKLGRGVAWFDTGSAENLYEASQLIRIMEKRIGYKIGCIEEIAFNKKWIDKKQYKKLIEKYKQSEYGKYLLNIIK